MFPRIIITGSIQCGKSTLVRAILDHFDDNISGYFSQKKMNFEKKHLEIWLSDFCSDLTDCFASKKENENFSIHLNRFDSFLKQIISSDKIPASQIFCIDEIGFLERDSTILKNFILTFPKFEVPIILVVQKRIFPDFQKFFPIPPWQLYDLDFYDSKEVKDKIFTLLKT